MYVHADGDICDFCVCVGKPGSKIAENEEETRQRCYNFTQYIQLIAALPSQAGPDVDNKQVLYRTRTLEGA